jgi:hypothetical protein
MVPKGAGPVIPTTVRPIYKLLTVVAPKRDLLFINLLLFLNLALEKELDKFIAITITRINNIIDPNISTRELQDIGILTSINTSPEYFNNCRIFN